MNRFRFALVFLFLFGGMACSLSKEISSGIPEDPKVGQNSAQTGNPLPKKFSRMFTGTLAERTVKLQLTGDETKLSGFYVVTDDNRPTMTGPADGFSLDGDISDSGQVRLIETDNTDNQTGKIYGTLSQKATPAGNTLVLKGTWTKMDGSGSAVAECVEEKYALGAGASLIYDLFKDDNEAQGYAFAARFPFVKGTDAAWAKSFNDLSKKQALINLEQFKKEANAFWTEIEKKGGKRQLSGDPDDPNRVFMAVEAEVRCFSEQCISVQYTTHVAFGQTQQGTGTHVLNIDRASGKELKLADVFAPNAKYVEKISQICLQTAQTGSVKPEEIMGHLEPKPELYANWNLMPKGLVFTFRIGGKLQGLTAEIFIPYREVKDLLNPAGPLGGKV
ncbi:MAG: RsiV family protein [Blastocatellia bacterium]|nr:RsiV family protein [Blastocatellia bacterium]